MCIYICTHTHTHLYISISMLIYLSMYLHACVYYPFDAAVCKLAGSCFASASMGKDLSVKYVCIYICMKVCMDVWMYYVRMHVCMYVMYVFCQTCTEFN